MLGQAAAGVLYLCKAGAPSNSCDRPPLTWSHSAAYCAVGRSDCVSRPGQQQACGHGVVTCRSRSLGCSGTAAVFPLYQGGAHTAAAGSNSGISLRHSRYPPPAATVVAAAGAGASSSSTLPGVSPHEQHTPGTRAQTALSSATVLDARALTHRIAKAKVVAQLQQLVMDHARHMDHIHVAAVINRAAQLQQAGGWQHAAALGGLGGVPEITTAPISSSSNGSSSSSSNTTRASSSSGSGSGGRPPDDLRALRAAALPLLQQHLPHMQGRQLVTCLHSCVRLGWLTSTSRLTQQLLNQCALHMEELTPQGLCLAVHACALLEVTPSPAWVGAWCRRLRQQLEQLQPQDVAVAVWSVGRLRLPLPHPDLWQQLLRRSGALMHQLQPQELLLVALGAAHAGQPLPAGWLRRWCSAAHPRVHTMGLLELCNLVWALARLHAAECGPLLQEVRGCVAAQQQQGAARQAQRQAEKTEGRSSSSTSSSSSISSSSRPEGHPRWQQEQQHPQQQPGQAPQHLLRPSGAASATLVTGSPGISQTSPAPHPSTSAKGLQGTAAAGSGWLRDPQYACKLLWSLAALRPLPGSPTAGIIQEWLGALQLQLLTGQPVGLGAGGALSSVAAVAAGGSEGTQFSAGGGDAKLPQQEQEQQRQEQQPQQQPGPPFVASAAAAEGSPAAQQPSASDPQHSGPGGVTTPASAAAEDAEMLAKSSAVTPAAGAMEVAPCQLSPLHCTMLVLGLARFQHPSLIHPRIMPYWLQQAAAAMPSAAAGELAGWAWALGRLRYRPDAAWLKGYLDAVAAVRGALDPQEMVMVLWGLARLQVPLDVLWLAGLLEEAAEALPAYGPREVALLVWTLGAGRVRPNKAFMALLLQAALKQLRDAGEQDLVGLVVGLARLGYTPPRRWVAVYLRVVGAKAPLVSPRGRATITAALADLGWAPAEQQRIMVSML